MSVFDKDWFDRKHNYVVKDESKSIGWDSSFSSEFSMYLYSSTKAESLCSNPETLVKEFREIMNSINLKNDTECYINSVDDCSYTDGKKIFVSIECLKDNISCFNKLDILIGLLLHESAHCLYSDFNNLVEATDKTSIMQKHIQNILEDEIIEEKLCNKNPGNSNFIYAVKEKYFRNTINEITENKPTNLLDEIFSVFLLAIRYPENLIEYVNKSSNKEFIEKIFKEIYEAAYFSGYFKVSYNYDVTKKTKDLSKEIIDIILKYVDLPEQYDECSSDANSSISKYSESTKQVESYNETFSEKERKAIENKFQQILETELNDKCYEINRDIYLSNLQLKESAFRHNANKQKYNDILNSIKKYVYSLRKKVLINKHATKDKLFVYNNMRTGTLNVSKLAEAYQGIEHIYDKRIVKREKIQTAKYALVIVIDESGSMQNLKEHIEQIAILLYEAFSNEKEIELFVFGHGDRVNVYIDKSHKNKYVLADTAQQYDQNEGKSYEYILQHVHSQTKLNSVIISLTDSYYCFDPDKFKSVIEEAKTKHNDSFNLIKLKLADDFYDMDEVTAVNEQNDSLYGENCWIEVNCLQNNFDNTMEQIVNTLAPILLKNYLKSEKLHR